MEVSNTDFIIKLLKENGGISYLPRFAAEESIRRGELMVLEVRDLKTIMYQQIFLHKSKWRTREMDEFIARVTALAEES